MQEIDFINGRGYEVISFPDGEKHLRLIELDRKEEVAIKMRIKSSDDLFLLMQLSDILKRQCVNVRSITIPYLMGMRCDRLFSLDESFSLKIVAGVINSFNASEVRIFEPHSQRSLTLINRSTPINPSCNISKDRAILCFPDKGARDRYSYCVSDKSPIICSKVRDIGTGELRGFLVERIGDYVEGDEIIVLDDLCDGGGTFLGIAEKLRLLKPSKLTLAVTHAVNPLGIERVSKTYDEVIITNTFADWDNLSIPSNVKVINVI